MQQSSAKTTACSRTRVVNQESCGRWQASRNFVQLISCAGHMQPGCYILNLWNFDDPVDHLDFWHLAQMLKSYGSSVVMDKYPS